MDKTEKVKNSIAIVFSTAYFVVFLESLINLGTNFSSLNQFIQGNLRGFQFLIMLVLFLLTLFIYGKKGLNIQLLLLYIQLLINFLTIPGISEIFMTYIIFYLFYLYISPGFLPKKIIIPLLITMMYLNYGIKYVLEDFNHEDLTRIIQITLNFTAFSFLSWLLFNKQIRHFQRNFNLHKSTLSHYEKINLLIKEEKNALNRLVKEQTATLITIEESEKNLLAESLHDNLGQKLSSIKLLMELNSNKSESLDNVKNSITKDINWLRTTISELASRDVITNFSTAIKNLETDFMNQNCVEIIYSLKDLQEAPDYIKYLFFRVIKNTLISYKNLSEQIKISMGLTNEYYYLMFFTDPLHYALTTVKSLKEKIDHLEGFIILENRLTLGPQIWIKT